MIVDLLPTDDQQMIDDSVRALLADRLPVERLRETGAHGGNAERAIWDELISLGIFGLGLSEEQGGLGLGMPEEVLVARALGQHLVSPDVLAQIAAVHLARDARQRAALLSGELRTAFATVGGHILDGADAAHILLMSPDGIALVPIGSLSISGTIASLDDTVTLRSIGPDFPAIDEDGTRTSLLISAYLTGIALAATDMAVIYAGTREQFGQPIGAFQAIKHMCADMATRAAAAEAQTFFAAATFGLGVNDVAEVAAARLLSNDAALANAKANIQIHGGMGFTAECDAHLFLKRAHLMSSLGSNRTIERKRILGTLS